MRFLPLILVLLTASPALALDPPPPPKPPEAPAQAAAPPLAPKKAPEPLDPSAHIRLTVGGLQRIVQAAVLEARAQAALASAKQAQAEAQPLLEELETQARSARKQEGAR